MQKKFHLFCQVGGIYALYHVFPHLKGAVTDTKELVNLQGRLPPLQGLLCFPRFLSGAAATCCLHYSYCKEHELLAAYLSNSPVNVEKYIFYLCFKKMFFKVVLTIVET